MNNPEGGFSIGRQTHPASWRGFVVRLTSAATVDTGRPHIIVTQGNTTDKANSGSAWLAPSNTLHLQVDGSTNQALVQSILRTCPSVTPGEAPSEQTLNTHIMLFRDLSQFLLFYFHFCLFFAQKDLGYQSLGEDHHSHVSRERLALSQPNLPSCPPRVMNIKYQ